MVYRVLMMACVLCVLGCGSGFGGSVCAEADEVIEEECGIEPLEDGGEELSCSEDAQEAAQCIVDNSQAYCAFLDDPRANKDNAYARCIESVQ